MLVRDGLSSAIRGYLEELCRFPDRYPDRAGNRAATELFARVAASQGLEVEVREMDCLDFERGDTELVVDGVTFPATAGPVSNPAFVRARLAVASTADELEAGGLEGSVLLLRGELCCEPLTPKSFTYFEMPGHRRIVAALEAARPAPVIAATGRCPDLAGSLYPFLLINDGEFDIPNAFLTDTDRAAGRSRRGTGGPHAAEPADPGAGAAVPVALSSAPAAPSHESTWPNTTIRPEPAPHPGARATTCSALLGLAHLLSGYAGRLTVELVPLNGEDYYGATGEKRFERDNEGHWDDVVLGMNVDAAGWRGHATEVSLFGLDDTTDRVVRSSVSSRPGFAVGEPWYQSDHGLFRLHGRPAVAVISEGYAELAANVTHTAADGLELADPGIAADVSTFFADVIAGLEEVAGAAEVMPMRRVRPRATSEVRTGRAPRTRSSVPDGPSPRSAP